jgi:hypothetical protein
MKMDARSFKRLAPVLVIFVLTAASAFAKNDKNERRLTLNHAVSVNGTTIPAGTYKVAWVSHSPEATVTFLNGQKAVATSAATWVDRGTPYQDDAVVYSADSDGSRSIVEIRFKGMSKALVFGSAGATS